LIRLDAGERRPRRSGGGQPLRLTGRDKWAGFNIYVVRSSNCLTRPRAVELQAVIIEQTLPRWTAAKVQRPNSAWQRICETGTNATIQRTPRRNRQQDVSELICARAGRQQWQDIANRLFDQNIGCRSEKRAGKKWLIEGVILVIVSPIPVDVFTVLISKLLRAVIDQTFPGSQSDLPMKKPAGLRRRVGTQIHSRYTRHRLIEGYRRQVKKRFRGLSASKNEDVTRTSLDPAIYLPLTVSGHD
jgi:hypothetical protein